jgi:hypothetical protein
MIRSARFGPRLATHRRAFRRSGTDGSNPVPSSGESANHRFLSGGANWTESVVPHPTSRARVRRIEES